MRSFTLFFAKTLKVLTQDLIQNTARTIGSSGFLTKFKEWFVPLYQRGNSETNYWAIAGKTAEHLLNLFKEIAANSDKSREVLTC